MSLSSPRTAGIVRTLLTVGCALALLLAGSIVIAPAARAAGYIETGSDDPVSAAPDVSHPSSASCSVTLADKFLSNGPDNGARNFAGTLAPPPSCAGPWAKVILDYTVSVNGRQYDRSGTVTIGGVTVWFGTTQEPSGPTPIHYTVSKDITRYSALLRNPQPFTGGIVNYVTDVYTGNYLQTVTITYYRADSRNPAPVVPDVVRAVPVPDLNPGAPSATVPLNALPRNIIGADLEIALKGNGCDEQWFTAVPDQVSAKFPDAGLCAHGSYREAMVSVDGARAGAVGTYPHIYSGGIVPTLWRPVLAIDTLDLRSEQLDLTPFAGRLVDGAPHQFSFAISPIGDTWNVVATLFLSTDSHREQTEGALTTDAVAASPTSTVTSSGTGTVRYSTTGQRHDVTAGYLDTSAGRVSSTVTTSRSYHNAGTVSDNGLVQSVQQTDRIGQTSISANRGRIVRSSTSTESYPIEVDFSAADYVNDQNFSLQGTVRMGQTVASSVFDGRHLTVRGWTWTVDSSGVLSRVDGVNTESDGHSSTSYLGTDDRGRLYLHRITTNHGRVLTDRHS